MVGQGTVNSEKSTISRGPRPEVVDWFPVDSPEADRPLEWVGVDEDVDVPAPLPPVAVHGVVGGVMKVEESNFKFRFALGSIFKSL